MCNLCVGVCVLHISPSQTVGSRNRVPVVCCMRIYKQVCVFSVLPIPPAGTLLQILPYSHFSASLSLTRTLSVPANLIMQVYMHQKVKRTDTQTSKPKLQSFTCMWSPQMLLWGLLAAPLWVCNCHQTRIKQIHRFVGRLNLCVLASAGSSERGLETPPKLERNDEQSRMKKRPLKDVSYFQAISLLDILSAGSWFLLVAQSIVNLRLTQETSLHTPAERSTPPPFTFLKNTLFFFSSFTLKSNYICGLLQPVTTSFCYHSRWKY